MILFFIIILSIWFNHYLLVNNENFILGIFLISFFWLIYTFLGFSVKSYFFFRINSVLGVFKYLNIIEIYLDKILYQNLIIKKLFLKNISKNKNKLIGYLIILNQKINNFLLSNIFNFFLSLKKNIYKLLKNKKLLVLKNNISGWDIIL